METRTLKLSESFVNRLIDLPESGMGYQLVKVILRGGKILRNHKVLNSSLLVLEADENIKAKDIEQIELEKKEK
ncbi:MAG TPA: hypothetical protein PLD87_11435 [Bacteroidia bacterium]|nr:hypothetical protein [Bacteroidia bacterium]